MAEREGFEPPIALRLCLISSQVHSTGLCHLSAMSVGTLARSYDCTVFAGRLEALFVGGVLLNDCIVALARAV